MDFRLVLVVWGDGSSGSECPGRTEVDFGLVWGDDGVASSRAVCDGSVVCLAGRGVDVRCLSTIGGPVRPGCPEVIVR